MKRCYKISTLTQVHVCVRVIFYLDLMHIEGRLVELRRSLLFLLPPPPPPLLFHLLLHLSSLFTERARRVLPLYRRGLNILTAN